MTTLAQLLEPVQPLAAPPGAAAALPVADLTQDSREVRAGSVFVALRGRSSHGLQYAAQAIAQGAVAILWEPGDGSTAPVLPPGVAAIAVPGLAAHAGLLADRFFGAPSSRLRITAFTGTNGKTTCAYLLAQCLGRLQGPAAYVGTLGWGRIGALQPLAHTTPDAIGMHRLLARLVADGIRDVAIEASSHALDQQRLAGVRLHAAAFTNLTHDHLDYHGSMAAYGEAKARLFAFPGWASWSSTSAMRSARTRRAPARRCAPAGRVDRRPGGCRAAVGRRAPPARAARGLRAARPEPRARRQRRRRWRCARR